MDHQYLLIAGAGLAISILAVTFSRRTGVATPLLLIAPGFAASYLPGAPALHIDPELILTGVLPPLLYAASVRLPVQDVRRNLGMITWLAMVIVVVGAVVVGLVVHALFGVPLALAVALGAVVGPTDAVAATAIGRRLGLPPRVMSVLEGESLVNDASALVLLRSAFAAISVGAFDIGEAALDFTWAVLGALIAGAVVGWVTVLVRQRLADPVRNTSISFAVPFLAFVPAEEMGASGVLAVVVAGLITGHESGKRFTARDRQTERTNWATINFLLENAVFLAMGFELRRFVFEARGETSDGQIAAMVGVVLALLIVIRFIGIAGPLLISRQTREERAERQRERLAAVESRLDSRVSKAPPTSAREEQRISIFRRRIARSSADVDFDLNEPLGGRSGMVLAWCGMRGVVTIAAVQTIPLGTEQRSTVVVVAVLVAVATLVLFGITLPLLIGRINLKTSDPERERKEFFALMRQLAADAEEQIGPLDELEVEGRRLDPALVTSLQQRFLPILLGQIQQLRQSTPGLRETSLLVQRLYVDTMREALLDERSVGGFSSHAYAQAEALLDREEHRLNAGV